MRALAMLTVAATVVAVVGCSQNGTVSPTNDSSKFQHVSAQLDYLIKIPPIEGETEALEHAMEIYSGEGSQAIGLLLPAVQKVREAMHTMMEEADREGNVDADVVLKIFRNALHTFKPAGDEMSINDICLVSLSQNSDDKHKNWIEVLSFKGDDAANAEWVFFHFYNGLGILFEQANMASDDAASALQGSMGFVEEFSDLRIQGY